MKIQAGMAILDVKKGRKALYKEFKHLPFEAVRIPITITGYIVGVWGEDDGIRREFEVEVSSVKVQS